MIEDQNSQASDTKAEEYGRLLAIGTLILDRHLRDAESNDDRKQKKAKSCKEKEKILSNANVISLGLSMNELIAELESNLISDDVIKYIVDLLYVKPFFPNELKFNVKDHIAGVAKIGHKLGVKTENFDNILKTMKAATKAYHKSKLLKVVLISVGGLVVLGTGGYLAAPIIAAAIGAAAGLSGAAATSFGLAFLGGGSLATGGAGMAGGLWLVTGTGGVLGLGAGAGAGIIHNMGASDLKNELIKLEITFKEVTLKNTENTAVARGYIIELTKAKEELQKALEKAKLVNDKNSQTIKSYKEKLTIVEKAITRLTKFNEDNRGL